jgi:hypothetical protein
LEATSTQNKIEARLDPESLHHIDLFGLPSAPITLRATFRECEVELPVDLAVPMQEPLVVTLDVVRNKRSLQLLLVAATPAISNAELEQHGSPSGLDLDWFREALHTGELTEVKAPLELTFVADGFTSCAARVTPKGSGQLHIETSSPDGDGGTTGWEMDSSMADLAVRLPAKLIRVTITSRGYEEVRRTYDLTGGDSRGPVNTVILILK